MSAEAWGKEGRSRRVKTDFQILLLLKWHQFSRTLAKEKEEISILGGKYWTFMLSKF